MRLRARKIILLGTGQPIVLCALDWIGIANEGYDAFREVHADVAGIIPNRVAVIALHIHNTSKSYNKLVLKKINNKTPILPKN